MVVSAQYTYSLVSIGHHRLPSALLAPVRVGITSIDVPPLCFAASTVSHLHARLERCLTVWTSSAFVVAQPPCLLSLLTAHRYRCRRPLVLMLNEMAPQRAACVCQITRSGPALFTDTCAAPNSSPLVIEIGGAYKRCTKSCTANGIQKIHIW